MTPTPELPLYEKAAEKSQFLYHNPEENLTPEMREWLSKSRIAHIAPLWLPLPRDSRNYGGAEDVVFNNIRALEKFGTKSQYIFGNPNNITLEKTVNGAKVFVPDGTNPREDLLYLLRKDRVTAERKERNYVLESYNKIKDMTGLISIVHDHTNYGRDHGGWLAESSTPVVRTEHGPLTYPDTTELEEANLRQFIERNDMGFIAISNDQKSRMPDLNWAGVNYNGVDLQDFSFKEKKDNFLLFLGRLNPTKGAHNAIELAKRSGLPLVIAGSVEETDPSIKYYEEEIKPHIDQKKVIHLENGVNADQRKELVAKAKALLMLIEWNEPFGMVMAEALASGTPVVGYKRGSVPEIVQGNTGFVVEDLEGAESAVNEVIKGNYSPQECRERAERLFSKEAMAIRNIKIYMEQEKKFLNKEA